MITTNELHKLGREYYDTPASVRACACAYCNRARVSYGRRPRRWVYTTKIAPDGTNYKRRLAT